MSGQRVGDSRETLPKIRVIPKIQHEAADRPDALRDASGPDGLGEIKRVCRRLIEGQQLPAESELADQFCQPIVRAGGLEERGGTLESLHSSSVAAAGVNAYIV